MTGAKAQRRKKQLKNNNNNKTNKQKEVAKVEWGHTSSYKEIHAVCLFALTNANFVKTSHSHSIRQQAFVIDISEYKTLTGNQSEISNQQRNFFPFVTDPLRFFFLTQGLSNSHAKVEVFFTLNGLQFLSKLTSDMRNGLITGFKSLSCYSLIWTEYNHQTIPLGSDVTVGVKYPHAVFTNKNWRSVFKSLANFHKVTVTTCSHARASRL